MTRPSLGGTAALFASGLALVCCQRASAPAVADDGWGPSGGLGPASHAETQKPRPAAPRARLIPEPERRRWQHAEALAGFNRVGGRGPSEHQASGYERTVVVNDAARGYAQLVAESIMAAGAMVAQRHHPAGSDEVSSWYVMFKPALTEARESQPQGWRFLVLDARLRVAASDDLELCARCHLEAPHDGLFGPPPDLSQLPASSEPEP